MKPQSTNSSRRHATVTRARRGQANGHKSAVSWLARLPAAGKSITAHAPEEGPQRFGCRTYDFGGDNVYHGLCRDPGFSNADRAESLRQGDGVTKLSLDPRACRPRRRVSAAQFPRRAAAQSGAPRIPMGTASRNASGRYSHRCIREG